MFASVSITTSDPVLPSPSTTLVDASTVDYSPPTAEPLMYKGDMVSSVIKPILASLNVAVDDSQVDDLIMEAMKHPWSNVMNSSVTALVQML